MSETDSSASMRPHRDVVLILRALGIGDLLVSVPALRALRAHWPDSRLVLACPEQLRPLVSAIGCVDDILPVVSEDLGRGLSDEARALRPCVHCVVNLHGRGPGSHAWLDRFPADRRWGHAAAGWSGPTWIDELHERWRWVRMLSHFGVDGDAEDMYIDPTCIQGQPRSAAAVIHVGASQPSRLWPSKRFAEVGAELLRRGHEVVLTGSAADRAAAAQTLSHVHRELPTTDSSGHIRAAAGEQSLSEFCGTIAAADLVVTADTGAAHLASAFSRPSVVIFGPASVRNWGPPVGPHRVLTHVDLRRGDLWGETPDPALLAVTVPEVLDALDSLGM